jgi:hypothetical protein
MLDAGIVDEDVDGAESAIALPIIASIAPCFDRSAPS